MSKRFFYEIVAESDDDTVVSVTDETGEEIIQMTIDDNFDDDDTGEAIETEILDALIEDGEASEGDTIEELGTVDDPDEGFFKSDTDDSEE